MPRTPSLLAPLLAGLCLASALPAVAQTASDPMQAVQKCVRGSEVFYTNGECPKGARPLKLNDPMGEPVQRAAPRRERSAEQPPASSRNSDAWREDAGSAQPATSSSGFKPLNSFPPLPESVRSEAPSERREVPVRAAPRAMENTPPPESAASNQAMCGFVAAELSRLNTELGSADEAGKTRIATHQKRLNERAAQLKCS